MKAAILMTIAGGLTALIAASVATAPARSADKAQCEATIRCTPADLKKNKETLAQCQKALKECISSTGASTDERGPSRSPTKGQPGSAPGMAN